MLCGVHIKKCIILDFFGVCSHLKQRFRSIYIDLGIACRLAEKKQASNQPNNNYSYKIRQTQHILVDICCTQHIDDRVDKENPTKLARKFFAIIFKHPTGSRLLFFPFPFPFHFHYIK